MKKVVWTGLLMAFAVGLFVTPAAAQSRDGRQRMRAERHHRLEQRRLARLDRNRDGRISRREIARYRADVRRAVRRALRSGR